MQFSQRTNWDTEESALARVFRLRREAGLPIADLTASNPTRCGFEYSADLLDLLNDPRALDYDPNPRGSLDAREAISAYYAERGATVRPEQIILTTSTSEAYSFLFKLLCDPYDRVLALQPSYPLFDYLAGLEDLILNNVSLVYDHGWQIEPESLRRSVTFKTGAVVLVHPNNPTGHFTKEWEARELAQICGKENVALIVDEVFLDYPMPGTEPNAVRTFASGLVDANVFVVSGLSKIAGLPQMKAAWIVATGPDSAKALERLEVIADTFLSMNAPVQCALPVWLAGAGAMQAQIRARVAENLAELDQCLSEIPQVSRLAVEGGWYATLRIPAVQPDEKTVLELLELGLWIQPGYFFGMADSGWLVVSLLTPTEEFKSGLKIFSIIFR